ncbi:inositol 2-dehydrogenase [Commensalibacter oyaizuii]|uniref:Inositol 2-dehydrogenase n=1 Tax=Commensalibacter oyaizuii TaxID=3043873 RepID=A0ABT6PZ57_9PROT|nr:inositol 2-dehydrogenase [Commensalibacter sp. TBRC 16381]MDI2090139.1 inositol 2-dehydrogenase [Commensalibacter sp. TBRC 16381]
MVNIAVLGTGRIGQMHVDNLAAHPRAQLGGVFDVNTSAAQAVANKHNTILFNSINDVFASPKVDAVLISTSTATHADLIEQAVAANKAIFCEKPIDLSLDRIKSCEQKIKGTSLPIMLGFVRRFDKGHSAVRQAVELGKVGDLHQVIITSRDPDMAPDAYIEVSGGIFKDMTIHDFDMARFILGEDITEVFASGSRLVNESLMKRCNDYDTVTIVMKTASGKQCIINNSRRAVYGYDQRVEAFGSQGMAISENHPMNNLRLYSTEFTDQKPALMNFFIDRYGDAFNTEISHFVECIEQGKQPKVGFEDGKQALVLAEAASRSIIEGRTIHTKEI